MASKYNGVVASYTESQKLKKQIKSMCSGHGPAAPASRPTTTRRIRNLNRLYITGKTTDQRMVHLHGTRTITRNADNIY